MNLNPNVYELLNYDNSLNLPENHIMQEYSKTRLEYDKLLELALTIFLEEYDIPIEKLKSQMDFLIYNVSDFIDLNQIEYPRKESKQEYIIRHDITDKKLGLVRFKIELHRESLGYTIKCDFISDMDKQKFLKRLEELNEKR